jgi:rare lipoprotein A
MPEHEVYEMFLAKKLFRAPKHGPSTTLVLDPPPPGAIVSVQMKRILSVAVAAGILLSGCGGKKRARLPVVARVGATETGTASWYGRPYHGRRAANGEIYDMEKMTAAHRTLPFGTWLEVKNLSNDKVVKVRITDRGPFVGGRILDLSHAAAVSIAMVGPGVAKVKCIVIAPPVGMADDSVGAVVPQPAPGLFAVQTGSFADRRNAERLRASMELRYGSAKLVVRDAQPVQWRVLVGREATQEDAAALADRIRTDPDAQATGAFVVRLDEAAPDSIQ